MSGDVWQMLKAAMEVALFSAVAVGACMLIMAVR